MSELNLYLVHQAKIQTGDLIEYRGYNLIAQGIRAFTGREVNHSALAVKLPFGDDLRRFSIEAVGSGLEFRLLSKKISDHNGEAWWYALKPEFDHLRPIISAWAFKELATDRGYDFDSIFRQIFGRVSLDARRFFCSEYYDAMLVEFKIAHADPRGARRPGDFAELGIFESKARIA